MRLPTKTAINWRFMMKISAGAYNRGSTRTFFFSLARVFAAALWAFGLLAIAVPAAVRAEPQGGAVAATCTNPYSGVTWQIKIDYERRTVDSNPAQIDGSTISWRDATNGWYYELDRKSGNLTVTVASATGGNFLHDQCKLDH
jgi:hypothetical protein